MAALLALGLLLACGDKDPVDTGDADPGQSLGEALAGSIPASWATVCVTWVWEWDDDSTFVALEPTTGEQVVLSTRLMGDEDWDVHGLAWDGHALVSSGEEQSVARIDPLTGVVERPDTDLVNVLTWGDRLLVERDGAWAAHPDWDAALAGTDAETVEPLFDERFALRGDYAWTSQPDGDKMKVWHVPTGVFGELYLDGFDGTIWGLSIVDSALYLLNDGRQETGKDYNAQLFRFDADTGQQQGKLDLGVIGFAPRGLVCEAL